MSTATCKIYGQATTSLATKKIDWLGADVKVSLHNDTYTPNQDLDQWWTSVAASEVTGSGYVHGGLSLTGKTADYSASGHQLSLSANDITWPNSTITAAYAVFYVNVGTQATDPLICWWDFAGLVVSSASAFTLTLASAGLVTLSVV